MSDKYPGGFVTAGAPAGFSVAFDGTGDYLSMSSGTSLGAGNFTIECWVYLTAAPAGETTVGSSSDYYTAGFNGNFVFRVGTTNLWRSFDAQSNQATIDGTFTWSTGQWYHMAWVRNSGTVTVYRNGVSLGSVADSKTLSDSTNGYAIAATKSGGSFSSLLTGYISNLRVVVGTALYTTTFTPPTQLLNISGTSFLTCNSPTIIDQSTNAFAITVAGDAKVSNFTPFAGYTGFNPALGAAAGGVWTLDEAAYYQQNRIWPIYDPYFNQTTLMLHGNGTNGAQNNTFLDSSVNNFTITRNGNTTQGTFTPFSQTGWSNFFNGSSYLTVNNAATQLALGTVDWQIELWCYPTSLPGSGDNLLYDGRPGNGAYPMFSVRGVSAASPQKVIYYTNTAVQITSDGTVPIGAWTHVMVSRVSSVTRMFINGVVQSQTYADTTNYLNDSTHPQLGRNAVSNVEFWNGYMANVRVLKGSGTSTSFTPSTAPLTATTNTVLLTCQSNRLLDNSANNFSITDTGSGSIQAFSPFVPAYITPTTYSNYFNGSSSYLSVASSALDVPSSTNFTIEGWVYLNAHTNNQPCIFNNYTSGGGLALFAGHNSFDANLFNLLIAGSIYSGGTIVYGQWTHFAVVRNGTGSGNVSLYINGISVLSTISTNAAITYTGQVSIGTAGDATSVGAINGCISNFRWNTTTAVYTAAFTPPTAPLTAISGTQLLTCQNSTFIDNSTNNLTLTAAGTVQPVTSPTPFPAKVDTTTLNSAYSTSLIGGSAYFDGTTDYLTFSGPTIGTGAFCLEAWIYCTSTFTNQTIFGADGTNNRISVLINNSTTIAIDQYGVSGASFTVATMALNAWNHIVLSRNGSSVATVFVNGVRSSTGAITLSNNYTTFNTIGRFASGDERNPTGYISGARAIIGSTPYDPTQTGFAPPIAPATPTNLTNNGTQSGTLTFVVGSDAPNTLYYVCQNHSAMAGVINIVNSGTYEKVYAVSANGSSNYVINGSSNPTLTLVRGETYTFNVNATGHPFWITTASGAYSAGNVYLGTALLLNYTNGAIFDNTAKNVVETVGNAQISTTQSKWGGSSMYFDSSGDCLSIPYSQTTVFGTGNFTMEAWVYPLSWPNNAAIISGNGVTNSILWGKYDSASNFGVVNDNVAWIITDGTLPTINTWSHVALVRSGTTMKMYVNGIQTGSTATNSSNFVGPTRVVGARNTSGSSGAFDGYIEDVRITTGVARYLTNFTPPTSQLQDQ